MPPRNQHNRYAVSLGNRLQMLHYIENNPGVHIRKISRAFGLGVGTTQYHLVRLEKDGKIKSRKNGVYRRYYPAAIVDEDYKIVLGILRKKPARAILIQLLEHPSGLTQSEIANSRDLASATVNWHMSSMINVGLVISKREGRSVRYFVNKNHVAQITHSLRTYYPTIWNNLANRIVELFLDIG